MHRLRLRWGIQYSGLVNVKNLLTIGYYLRVHVCSDGKVLFFEVDTLLEAVELFALTVFHLDFNHIPA